MMPISGVNTAAVQPLATAERTPGASKAQKPEEEARGRRLKPAMDEYVPEEPREPSGRYWMDRDGEGQPKVYFDGPERAADEGAKCAEKKDGENGREICNTDKVDREIEKLKKERQELIQRLSRETDEARIEALERRLAQVERELKQKDSDAYRRQNATYTQLS